MYRSRHERISYNVPYVKLIKAVLRDQMWVVWWLLRVCVCKFVCKYAKCATVRNGSFFVYLQLDHIELRPLQFSNWLQEGVMSYQISFNLI